MKKFGFIVALFVLLSSNDVSARGFVNNPDRFPSVGLSFGFSSLGGDASFPTQSPTPPAGLDIQTKDLTLDFRLLLSHSLTLFGGISVIRNEFAIEESAAHLEQDRELEGYGVRFGARFYFNR